MPAPEVSVLLPVFNGEESVGEAIDSILGQTFSDFEIVVVDDGSTDGSLQVVLNRASDPRIRIIRHERNEGLLASLRDGLAECRGELVARLDADDTALPTRLDRQVEVFRHDPSVSLCATGVRRVTPDGTWMYDTRPPVTHASLAVGFLLGNWLNHSTVMFRRETVAKLGGYDAEQFPAEDYDLWIRLLSQGTYSGVNSIEAETRTQPDGISVTRADEQATVARTLAHRYLVSLLPGDLNSDVHLAGGDRGWSSVRVLLRARSAIGRDLRTRELSRVGLHAETRILALRLMNPAGIWQRNLVFLCRAPKAEVLGLLDGWLLARANRRR